MIKRSTKRDRFNPKSRRNNQLKVNWTLEYVMFEIALKYQLNLAIYFLVLLINFIIIFL
jgi:hypothetical protein